MKLTIQTIGLFLLVSMTACSSLFPTLPSASTLLPGTEMPTATIVWFPPTHTPTPFLTQTIVSTPEQRPGLGELLFSDSFDQPDLWSTSIDSQAKAIMRDNKLILSISGQGPLPITSLRSQPLLMDFYAEANVTLSLCGGKDQFGMIFRAVGNNYYRFAVSCDGQARFERSLSSLSAPLIDWQPSGDAPSAAPAQVKLGVWAVGNEMRFFLNDHYQFVVRDPVLHSGALGFFAFVNGSTPITASFSDLSVYSVAYVSPTPSLIPSRTMIPTRTP